MSISNYNLQNILINVFKDELNSIISAIKTYNSTDGVTPSVTFGNMFWVNNNTNTLNIRKYDNSIWIGLGNINSSNMFNPNITTIYTNEPNLQYPGIVYVNGNNISIKSFNLSWVNIGNKNNQNPFTNDKLIIRSYNIPTNINKPLNIYHNNVDEYFYIRNIDNTNWIKLYSTLTNNPFFNNQNNYIISDTEPTNSYVGQFWLDTNLNLLKFKSINTCICIKWVFISKII